MVQSELQGRTVGALHAVLRSTKEYSCCFAEMPGFEHIHFHLIPKTAEFDPAQAGAKAFHYLKVAPAAAIQPAAVIELCRQISPFFAKA